jgi:hypothetical protein
MLIAATDNTFDIGASATTNRPRDIYAGRQLITAAGTAAAASHTFAGSLGTGLYSPGANRLGLASNAVARWEINAAGHLIAATHNSFDIGTSATANAPRDLFVARNATVSGTIDCQLVEGAAAATSAIMVTGRNVATLAANTRWTGSAYQRIDTARPSWQLIIGSQASNDRFWIGRAAAGTGNITTYTMTFEINTTGVLNPGRNLNLFAVRFDSFGQTLTEPGGAVIQTSWEHRALGGFTQTSRGADKAEQVTVSDQEALGRVRDPRMACITWASPSENRNVSPERMIGFKVEDVVQVVPEVTSHDDQGPAAINYGELVSVLWAALRAVDQRVTALETPRV